MRKWGGDEVFSFGGRGNDGAGVYGEQEAADSIGSREKELAYILRILGFKPTRKLQNCPNVWL